MLTPLSYLQMLYLETNHQVCEAKTCVIIVNCTTITLSKHHSWAENCEDKGSNDAVVVVVVVGGGGGVVFVAQE